VITQFFYVGAQICLFSFFLLYATKAAGIGKIEAADYLGWGCGMAFMTGRFIGTFLMNYLTPEKLLTLYAFICFALCLVAINATGMITVYAVISIAFFMSIMFPTIFSLGIKDLGNDTALGSSLLIMSIVGGAILPLGFGYISDVTGNIQQGYWILALSFLVIAWFGWDGYKIKNVSPQQF
jgi:FHS family L-fucose permease-like MFS transporter